MTERSKADLKVPIDVAENELARTFLEPEKIAELKNSKAAQLILMHARIILNWKNWLDAFLEACSLA